MKNLLTVFALLPLLAYSQDEGLVYYDYGYLDNIKTIKFHVDGYPTSMPIIELNSADQLLLTFDDLDGDTKNYVYTIEHCDANWNPSNIPEFDYIEGFSEAMFRDFDFSFRVQTKYTHYWLTFPNQDMRPRLSGNYLLKVYEDEDEKRLAVTRRFMVLDTKVKVNGRAVRPARVDKIMTHQEIDFTVLHEKLDFRSPQQELNATVVQNGRWDNAYAGLKPLFSKPGQQLFDYQDKIVFPAGKEFRYLDARGVLYPDPRILTISNKDGKYESVLEKDLKRGEMPYFEWRDINGSFVIQNSDAQNQVTGPGGRSSAGNFNLGLTPQEEREFQQRTARASTAEERADIQQERINLQNERSSLNNQPIFNNEFEVNNLQCEYIDVLFQLSSIGEMEDEDVYLFGAFTDWQLKPEYKMAFNPATNAYVAKATLKQGYYEYMYAELPHGSSTPNFDVTEGNWHEADNYYTILVYQRPFGGRYDQLIGAASFSSREQ